MTQSAEARHCKEAGGPTAPEKRAAPLDGSMAPDQPHRTYDVLRMYFTPPGISEPLRVDARVGRIEPGVERPGVIVVIFRVLRRRVGDVVTGLFMEIQRDVRRQPA
ncbi:hypothetical protein [Streptomyces griseorubiginosus]|uniref:hypothetical protein n=1 Tax=Streptomyces griseorubiginosus TaxID=67304 RepID=UPI0033EA2D41